MKSTTALREQIRQLRLSQEEKDVPVINEAAEHRIWWGDDECSVLI